MHDLGQRRADAALTRQVSITAERILLIAGLVSTAIILFAALGS
jgi:hypothetical protein